MITHKLVSEIDRIKRHAKILRLVVEKGPLGIFKLSRISGFPPHQVRYSLRILERLGLIVPSSKGAVATIKGKRSLRALKEEVEKIKEKLSEIF